MKNIFLYYLLDHYQSMSLLFGMMGNVFLAKYYEYLAYGLKVLLETLEKDR